jgi:chitinase
MRTVSGIGSIILLFFLPLFSHSQLPNPALVGYWQNWNDFQCPYIPLTQIDTSYNVIPVAFAVPAPGTTYNMTFVPDGISQINFKKQIDTMHLRGKKVLISIGGANDPVSLPDTIKRNTFISSMMSIINYYGFDGVDIDLEGSSLSVSGGTIANPVDAKIINLIYAIRKIMDNYRTQFGKKMMLTMAPETAYVQGGMSAYAGIWGAYLPVIHALRDSIEILHVQLYNSGSMYGIDGNIYFQGTVDFILSQTEAVIQGFITAGGFFAGLRADQIAVGLPACSNAAGGGYMNPDSVKAAIQYLRGLGPKPARYTKVGTYAGLRGMMDWSINWDAVASCGARYEYANNFNSIFRPSQTLNLTCLLEGFYNSSANSMVSDTIRAYLRDTLSPFAILDSSRGFMNASGSAICKFTLALNNRKYLLQFRHRNSIETWSRSSGVTFSSSTANYDLTSSASQAFGNNMIQVDSSPVRFAIYSGDVNQDGVVDAADLSLIDNASFNYATGYITPDVNGDNIVDATDASIGDNNAFNFVAKVTP